MAFVPIDRFGTFAVDLRSLIFKEYKQNNI